MVTIGKRIEQLRTEHGMTRPGLAAALGFPRLAIEKFETGRQTPTQAQQVQIAAYFGLTLEELRDEGKMGTWIEEAYPDPDPMPAPAPRRPVAQTVAQSGGDGATMFDAFLSSKKFQETLRAAVLDALKSPEGQEILTKIVRKELKK